jgi:hypothetical protein
MDSLIKGRNQFGRVVNLWVNTKHSKVTDSDKISCLLHYGIIKTLKTK